MVRKKTIRAALAKYIEQYAPLIKRPKPAGIDECLPFLKELFETMGEEKGVRLEPLEMWFDFRFPALRIVDKAGKIYGYIEVHSPNTPDPGTPYNQETEDYLMMFPNLLITNFSCFTFYSLNPRTTIEVGGNGREELARPLEDFLTPGSGFLTCGPDFCSRLLLRAFFLRDKVLPLALDWAFKSREFAPGLLKAYKPYFTELVWHFTRNDVISILCHSVFDGFLTAWHYYWQDNHSNAPLTPLNREKAFQLLKAHDQFKNQRRMELFKYLCSRKLSDAKILEWLLDDWLDFLSRVNPRDLVDVPWQDYDETMLTYLRGEFMAGFYSLHVKKMPDQLETMLKEEGINPIKENSYEPEEKKQTP